MPLSFREIIREAPETNPYRNILRGSYPALHASDVPTGIFYSNYLDTYITRDDSKMEVDLVDMTDRARPLLCEIKSGQTYRHSFARHLEPVAASLGLREADLQAG